MPELVEPVNNSLPRAHVDEDILGVAGVDLSGDHVRRLHVVKAGVLDRLFAERPFADLQDAGVPVLAANVNAEDRLEVLHRVGVGVSTRTGEGQRHGDVDFLGRYVEGAFHFALPAFGAFPTHVVGGGPQLLLGLPGEAAPRHGDRVLEG